MNQQQRRRRNREGRPSVGSLVSAAVVAYGTYRLANWVWNSWYGDDNDDDNKFASQQQEQHHQEQQQQEEQHRQEDEHDGYRFNNGTTSSSSRPTMTSVVGQKQRYPRMTPPLWRQRRQRMMRCRDEVLRAIEGFLPTLQKGIEQRTNISKESRALKQLRAQRRNNSSDCNNNNNNNNNAHDHDHNDPSFNNNQIRQTERELWEIIKVRSVTRMIASAYAHTILFLVVTVQVNLLGGKLFQEQLVLQQQQQQQQQQQNQSSSSTTAASAAASAASSCFTNPDNSMASSSDRRMMSYEESHKLVLQHTYKYFFEHGIVTLIEAVERAVTTCLKDWNVSDPSALNVSKERFDQIICNVRRALEESDNVVPSSSLTSSSSSSARTHHSRSLLLRYLVPPSESFDEIITNDLAKWILDETWDLLESPVLMDAQYDCLRVTFDHMRDKHWGKMFCDETEDDAGKMSSRYGADRRTTATSTTTTITRPLAHVITRLKDTSKSFFNCQQPSSFPEDCYNLGSASPRFTINSYCTEMEVLPSVLELADVSFN